MTHTSTLSRLGPVILGISTLITLGLSAPAAHAQSYTETVLHSFTGADGNEAVSELTAVGGTLYGTTFAGGASGDGTVYGIDTSGNFNLLHSFTGKPSDGANPYAGLTDVNGLLYGTTTAGGTSDFGTAFTIDTSGNLTTLHSFVGSATDGLNPRAAPTEVNGTFYGTTVGGGVNGLGTVYSMDSSGNVTVLHSFSKTEGDQPYAKLLDVNGTLYGTTIIDGASGDGSIFSIDTSGTFTELHAFTGSDGRAPFTGLTEMNGLLYGVAEGGGVDQEGTLYSIDSSGNFTSLYDFSGTGMDGAIPESNLIDVNGLLYGTTYGGGTYGYGTAFSFDPTSGNLTTLYSFGAPGDGQSPFNGLTDVGGVLYGTTESGGANGRGTVYALTPNSSIATPEPASWASFLLGSLGLLGMGLKTRRKTTILS